MPKLTAVIAAVLVAVVVSTQTAAADTFADTATATVNAARARYGAGPLVWDDALVAGMNRQADSCRFQHSPGAVGGRYGEDLYARSAQATVGDAVNAWIAEAGNYHYDNPVYSANTGHFTALVWKSSTRFAVVTKKDCPPGSLIPGTPGPQTFVIARFTPAGNIAGQFTQNVGRPR